MSDRLSSEIFLYECDGGVPAIEVPRELFGISERFGKEVIRRRAAPRGSHLANNMDILAKYGQVGHSVSKTDLDGGGASGGNR